MSGGDDGRQAWLAGVSLPFGLKAETVASVLQLTAVSILALLAGGHLIAETFQLPAWQIALASVALLIVVLSTALLSGTRPLLHWGLHLAMFAAGGVATSWIAEKLFPDGPGLPKLKLWTIYAGVYALLFIVAPRAIVWLKGGPRDPARFQAIRDDADEAHMRREAELVLLPSHSWYLLASWVTAFAMFGSFATTAIGFYGEIVDPYDPPILRYGIPIGLSALAAFIIWAGWNFVFLRLRVAWTTATRLLAWFVGVVVLVPLTLAIHSIFGIIGVGGTEGLRAHHAWYADVLSGYYDRADALAKVELKLKPQLELMSSKFKRSADREQTGGSGCGAGEGELFRYYSERASDVDDILVLINKREKAFLADEGSTQARLTRAIEDLRKRIGDPGVPFRDAQQEFRETFKNLRSDLLSLESSSIEASVQQFIGQLALVVEQDSFFQGWQPCQAARKEEIQAEIKNFLDTARAGVAEAAGETEAIRRLQAARIPRESRIDSFGQVLDLFSFRWRTTEPVELTSGDIPSFVPLRPFWAVVSYMDKLPGYIALQLALDFCPAILGLLFAVLAPFPSGKTRLGAWTDEKVDTARSWIKRRRGGTAGGPAPSVDDDLPASVPAAPKSPSADAPQR